MTYDLVKHLERQRAFSRATFGPGARTKGVVDHIRKELIEIEFAPRDLEEWVDVILLALDGAWRCADASHSELLHIDASIIAQLVVAAIHAKQNKNEARNWPDWRTADPDKAIEHVDHTRATITVPPGHYPVKDADGRATGEVRRICPKAGVPRRPCLYPQCDCDHAIGKPLHLPGDSGL